MIYRVPLRREPWPAGPHPWRPCQVCGERWVPWSGSFLPCHAKCLFTDATLAVIRVDPRGDLEASKHYGVSPPVFRAARHAAIKAWRR